MRVSEKLLRLRRFYNGMGLYGGGYISFMAIEFSVYESMLRWIEDTTLGKMSLIEHTVKSNPMLKQIWDSARQ